MKSRIKKLAITSLVAVCCVAGGVTMISASAQNYVEGDVAVAGFSVTDGAGVLIKENYAGIRFETHVTTNFMNYLYDTYGDTTEAGTTYEWHTLVTGTNMLPNDAVTDVTPELTKAEIGKADELACKNFRLEPIAESTGVVYRAAILYYGDDWESLTAETKAKYYEAELIARSYVEITQNNGTKTIIYASANDTIRSMKQVACTAVACEDYKKCTHEECADYTECQTTTEEQKLQKKNLLMSYIGQTATNQTAYYSEKDASGVIGNLKSGVAYKAYMNGALLEGVTATDNGLTVSNLATEDYAIGEDFELLLVGDDATLSVQPVKYVSDVITTAAELQAIVPGATYTLAGESESNTNGDMGSSSQACYFVLGNDIDLAADQCGFTFASATNNKGFYGTFDGCGYAIKNYSLTSQAGYGLFGILRPKTTVKNFSFLDASITGNRATLLGYRMESNAKGAGIATVENIYVDVDIDAASYGWGLFYTMTTNSQYAKIKDVVIESTVGMKQENYMGFVVGYPTDRATLPTLENVHVISYETRMVFARSNGKDYMAVSKTNYDAFVNAGKVTLNYKNSPGTSTYDLTITDGVATFVYNNYTMTLICFEGVTSYVDVVEFGDKQVGSWKYDATAGTFAYQK